MCLSDAHALQVALSDCVGALLLPELAVALDARLRRFQRVCLASPGARVVALRQLRTLALDEQRDDLCTPCRQELRVHVCGAFDRLSSGGAVVTAVGCLGEATVDEPLLDRLVLDR